MEAVLLVEVVSAIADFVQLPVITANGFQDGQRWVKRSYKPILTLTWGYWKGRSQCSCRAQSVLKSARYNKAKTSFATVASGWTNTLGSRYIVIPTGYLPASCIPFSNRVPAGNDLEAKIMQRHCAPEQQLLLICPIFGESTSVALFPQWPWQINCCQSGSATCCFKRELH